MSDGTNSKSWQKFISELNQQGYDFATVKHADEATRQELLASLPVLTALDRAAIATTWKRLVSAQPDGPSSESSITNSNEMPMQQPQRGGSRGMSSPHMGSPYGGGGGRQSSPGSMRNNNNNNHNSHSMRGGMQDNNLGDIFGQNVQSQYFDSQANSPGLPRSVSKAQPALLVPLNQDVGGGNSGSSLAQLREALQRGDCAASLPIASELLHADPIQLIHLLHHFLPQVSVEQLKVILGVGVNPQDLRSNDGASSSFTPPVKANSGYVPRTSVGSPRGNYSPRAGSGSRGGSQYSPTNGGGSYMPPSQSAFDGYADEEMSVQATMNGQPLSVGQVLTNAQVQSQYGMRFMAQCNGQMMKFPHMVARGDRITIRPATDRLL